MMMMVHSSVLSSSWTVMNNDDFTSVQTQAWAHTHVHIMTEVSLDVSETERLWLRSGRWFDWFWGRGDRSFWRWPVYSLSLPHRCAWLPPTGTPPLTTVKERDLEENITPGGQGPSGDPQETLQWATSVQTRPISSCRASPQSGAVKPETAAKRAVKFQLKFPSRDRLNLLWVCWAFLSSVVRHGFNSAAKQLASMSPSTSFFLIIWQTDSYTRAWLLHALGPPHCAALCRTLLNSHRDLKIPTREEIPPFRSEGVALQRHPKQ